MERPPPTVEWSLEDWSAVAEAIPHIVWVADPRGATLYVNQRGVDFTGGTSGSLTWRDMIHPDDISRALACWEQAVGASAAFDVDLRLRRRDGGYCWHTARAQPQLDAEGQVVRWVGTATDIHDRKLLEEHLRDARRETLATADLLDTLQATAPVGLGYVDRDLRIVRANAELARFARLPITELVGRPVADVVPQRWSQLEPVLRHVLDGGEAVRNLPLSRPEAVGADAHQAWLANFYPVHVGDEIVGVGIVGVDVTEQVQADEFRSTVMNQVADGVYTQDADGLLTYMNRAASKMLGWTEEELRGRSMHQVVHRHRSDGSPVGAGPCALLLEGTERRLVRSGNEAFARKDGSVFPVACSSMPLRVGETIDGISVVFRDVSDPAASTNLVRVLIADPDPASSSALTAMLTRHEGLEVVGVVRTSASAVEEAGRLRPDVVLVDVALPEVGPVATSLRIKREVPAASILLLALDFDDALAAGAIAAGCSGVVDKRRTWVDLAGAVRAAYNGETSISQAELQQVVTKVRGGLRPARAEDLTPREQEVLRCFAQGLSNQQVAGRLEITVNTVRNHVQRILYKLDVHSKLEAVVVATRDGLLDPPD